MVPSLIYHISASLLKSSLLPFFPQHRAEGEHSLKSLLDLYRCSLLDNHSTLSFALQSTQTSENVKLLKQPTGTVKDEHHLQTLRVVFVLFFVHQITYMLHFTLHMFIEWEIVLHKVSKFPFILFFLQPTYALQSIKNSKYEVVAVLNSSLWALGKGRGYLSYRKVSVNLVMFIMFINEVLQRSHRFQASLEN